MNTMFTSFESKTRDLFSKKIDRVENELVNSRRDKVIVIWKQAPFDMCMCSKIYFFRSTKLYCAKQTINFVL